MCQEFKKKMSEEFHERQSSKDCSVHSLNNALGRVVITPEEVAQQIDIRVAAFAKTLDLPLTDAKVKEYKTGLTKNNTFFSADSVWYAAAALGKITVPKLIERHEMLKYKNLIFLGIGKDGSNHAVGARNGFVYDSLNDGPPEALTDEIINTIYKEILGVFAFI